MSGSRQLKGFAYNIAQKFAASANHFAWLALHLGVRLVEIDLLSETISPAAFDIERNRILVAQCKENLLHIQTNFRFPAFQAAHLTATFTVNAANRDALAATYQCRIQDGCGRIHTGICSECTVAQA